MEDAGASIHQGLSSMEAKRTLHGARKVNMGCVEDSTVLEIPVSQRTC